MARTSLVTALIIGISSGCGVSTQVATPNASPTPTAGRSATPAASPAPSPTASIADIMEFRPLAPIESGTYFIDPDGDSSTPLRVVYEIPAEGWSMWIGGAKFADDRGSGPEPAHVGVSITSVVNLVRDGCHDHSWADPPIGPSVDDLTTALAQLAPFQVSSPPDDVTIHGYSGKHLELTVPELPVEHERFTDCVDGHLKSWVAWFDTAEPGDAYYGYPGPGYREELWILDVDGTRLMIGAGRSPGSPPEDLAEQQAILDSIRIEP